MHSHRDLPPSLYYTGLIIEFGVLGQTGTRVLNIQEPDDSPQGAVVNVQGPSFRPLPYRITYLTYDEFEAQSRNRNLDKIFPARPRAASGKIFICVLIPSRYTIYNYIDCNLNNCFSCS